MSVQGIQTHFTAWLPERLKQKGQNINWQQEVEATHNKKKFVHYLFSFYFILEDSIKFLPEVMFLKLKGHNVMLLCDFMIFYKPVLSLIDFHPKVVAGKKENIMC